MAFPGKLINNQQATGNQCIPNDVTLRDATNGSIDNPKMHYDLGCANCTMNVFNAQPKWAVDNTHPLSTVLSSQSHNVCCEPAHHYNYYHLFPLTLAVTAGRTAMRWWRATSRRPREE